MLDGKKGGASGHNIYKKQEKGNDLFKYWGGDVLVSLYTL
jgi:hypothetical protein